MRPFPDKNSIIVMDNCAIHHVQEVKDFNVNKNCFLKFFGCNNSTFLELVPFIQLIDAFGPQGDPLPRRYTTTLVRCGNQD